MTASMVHVTNLTPPGVTTLVGGAAKGGWLTVGNAKEDFAEKPIKALVLANGTGGAVGREGHTTHFLSLCTSFFRLISLKEQL
jgi:hypothetical protein